MPKSPAATRSYEHATLSFGLVMIPLDVFSGTANDVGISRKMVVEVDEHDSQTNTTHKVDHPVGYSLVDKVTGAEVERSEVVKKVVTEDGHLVFVEDHEIEKDLNLAPKTIKVLAFQPQHIFYSGAYVPKSLYYVEAQRVKIGKRKVANAAAEQALAMLLKAMRAEGAVAVVEFTTRGTPKPAVLLPDGSMWVVYHDEELREQRPLPQIEIDDAVVAQARMLMKANWSDQPLELSDKRTELIQALAERKAAAGEFGKVEDDFVEPEVGTAAPDLMAALLQSMQQTQAETPKAVGE